MEKRIREALDHIKIPEERREEMFAHLITDPERKTEQKRDREREKRKWLCSAAAALLVLFLIWEPAGTLARRMLFPAKDSVTGENGIQSVNIGQMGVTRLREPEDMKPADRTVMEMQKEPSGNMTVKTETRLLGSQKQYDSLSDMGEELELSFLQNSDMEEEPFSASLCIYDREGLSVAIADAKFFYGTERRKICVEIIMELEDSSKEYRYDMNKQSDYQGIYRREDGLFEAVLLQNNRSMAPDSQMEMELEDGGMIFVHDSRYFVPLNTYEAVFYYDGMRYNVYGAESPEMLKEILDGLRAN